MIVFLVEPIKVVNGECNTSSSGIYRQIRLIDFIFYAVPITASIRSSMK